MSVRFIFDSEAVASPPVRWAVETLASLMELRWRTAEPGEPSRIDEAPVFVGVPERAPEGVAAVITVTGWPWWKQVSLALASFGDVSIPCPTGRLTGPVEPDPAPAARLTLPPEWLRSVGYLLAREEEREDPRRDVWECYAGTYSRMHELGALETPFVNACARQLERHLRAWLESRGHATRSHPRWKDGARFAVALTHDVDDVAYRSLPGAFRLLGRARGPRSYAVRGGLTALSRALLGGSGPDPYDQFDRWTSEEERHGFRSSWYFVPPWQPRSRSEAPSMHSLPARSAPRPHELDPCYAWGDPVHFENRATTVAAMMKRLVARDWEVGLHGSYQSYRDSGELAREKRSIEEACGTPVAGVRQHFLRFDPGFTLAAQERAGFVYDTTLGYNEAIGFRAGIAAPFVPWDHKRGAPHALIEVPLTLMDGTLFRALALDPEQAIERVRAHLDRVEEIGGLAVLLWHPNAAAEAVFPGWWRAYTAALEEIEARRAWVAPAGEIARWWLARGRIA